MINEFNWSTLASNNINAYTENFCKKLDDLYCSAFPLKTKYITKRKAMNPWCTPELANLIKQKSVYFDMYRLGAITKQENNRFKNKVKAAINKAKTEYYKKLLSNNFGNMRCVWKILNGLMNREAKGSSPKSIITNNIEVCDDKHIADSFSDYFYNVPLELDSNVPDSNLDPLQFVNIDLNSHLFDFEPCTPDEVSSIISNMKITKQNKNSIPIRLFVANRDILSVGICDLINQSLSMGVFPNILKVAKIIPIHKKGDARTPSNYRPISILPFLSKIFEKIIYSRLLNHFTFNEILSVHQFGFRRQMSTFDAITHFTELIYDALNNKKLCLNILIDYSRAFDTVNHPILLGKLERYGVCGRTLQYIASYLKDRQQSVCIRGNFSTPKTSNISVPQGSVLGPLLFLIYVNEIPSVTPLSTPTMFADDCTLSISSSSIDSLIIDCNRELTRLKSWSDANRLTINIAKTNCLLIPNKDNIPPGSIVLDNQELDIVHCVKFLGVLIDDKLKFGKHIQYICGKISKSIGVLYRVRSLIPASLLKNLYFSIIQPYFLYCLPIFWASYDIHLRPLKMLQKRAIRLISNAGYLDNTDPLFYANNILKLDHLYMHCLACYIYSNQGLLETYAPSHNYSTRNRGQFIPPVPRLRSTEQSVIFNAIKVWNDIPADIKACGSKQNFKMKYKKYLLSSIAPTASVG